MKKVKLRKFDFSIKKLKDMPKYRFFFLIGCLAILITNLSTYLLTYGDFVSRFSENADGNITGIGTDTVIIDDAEADYNYYMGLNYTNSNNGTLPSGTNQELYGDSNLVQAKIIYNGTDINSGLRGYVSDEERQYVYIYYKTFAVNDNGTSSTSDDYIEIELIDNPYTYRPEDKAFNGWVTDYEKAVVSLDSDIYVRYAKVPVTYSGATPDAINITLHASWIDATATTVSSSRTWATAFDELENAGMQEVEMYEHIIEYAPLDMTGYFYQVIIPRYESYAGYYNDRGQLQNRGTCNNRNGCTYYELIENENYDADNTYYHLVNNRMAAVDESDLDLEIIRDEIVPNENIGNGTVAGYYRSVSISRGNSLVGYYNDQGTLQTSGTCGSTTCTYYELIQYYDDDGQVEVVSGDDAYYYLVTRDTNIIVMTTDMSTTWASAQSKPFTLTSFYGEDYRDDVVWNVSTYRNSWGGASYSGVAVSAYADTVIENIAISCGNEFTSTYNAASGTTSAGSFYGRFFNVKLGRGIVRSGSNGNFASILGGSNGATGSSGNVTEFRLMIESGYYNSISFANGVSNSSTVYMEGDAIYGNDYDRANNNDNSKLDVYYCASGSWGGNYYASTNAGVSFDLTVKSGSFGSSKYDHTTGIYIGGRYGGTHYTSRRADILGGYIYNIIGGPIVANNRGNIVDSYMYIRGGSIDMVTGGAGTTATYGHRIVQVEN